MAELADATDLKSVVRKGVRVRVPVPLPIKKAIIMDMYFSERSFDREQLIFIADVILTSALDRIASCIPSSFSLKNYEDNHEVIEAWINSAKETAGTGLATLYSQMIEDEIGIIEILDAIGFNKLIDNFIKNKNSNDNEELPNCRPLAKKYVKITFGDFLSLEE